MSTCKLCNSSAPSNFFCPLCTVRLEAQENPIICLACRDVKGALEAITWVEQTLLEDDTKGTLQKFEMLNGPAVFVYPTCSHCQESQP
jgi:hypothetical protein